MTVTPSAVSITDAAASLAVPVTQVHRMLRAGVLDGRRTVDGGWGVCTVSLARQDGTGVPARQAA